MINNEKIIAFRNFVLDAMTNPASRVRIEDGEIEVETKKKRSSSIFHFRVLNANALRALVRIGYSLDNGEFSTNSTEIDLPTSEVNELFYSIAKH